MVSPVGQLRTMPSGGGMARKVASKGTLSPQLKGMISQIRNTHAFKQLKNPPTEAAMEAKLAEGIEDKLKENKFNNIHDLQFALPQATTGKIHVRTTHANQPLGSIDLI